MSIGELEGLLGADDRVFYMSLPEELHQRLASWSVDVRAADAIDATPEAATNEGPLRKALGFAKATLPKLAAFASKAALEGEISHLLGG